VNEWLFQVLEYNTKAILFYIKLYTLPFLIKANRFFLMK